VANISFLKTLAGIISTLLLTVALNGCQSTPLPDNCYAKPESGRCRAAIERYYFDPQWQECRAFIWGGCDGVVPFENLESCQNTCPSLSDGHAIDPATDATVRPTRSSQTNLNTQTPAIKTPSH
tara:strand:- start:127457 stop:127828 length:372 start_codon:yes stop_codon:yes gene_type:complete